MPYTTAWNESTPSGGSDANKLDDVIRATKTDIRERISSLLGGLSLAEFQADPVKAKGIRGGGDADFDLIGGTATTTIRDGTTGLTADLTVNHATGDTAVRVDINAVGGYHHTLLGWAVTNIAASVAATEVPRSPGNRVLMASAGSVLAVVVALEAGQARTAGTLTVEVWRATINVATGVRTDTALGLIATIDGTNPVVKVTSQAKDLDVFNAGDELFLKYATDAGWLPVTADMNASIFVEA